MTKLFTEFRTDVRYALRTLRKTPTAVIVENVPAAEGFGGIAQRRTG